MKIIVDKYEYAKIIRACQNCCNGYGCCGKCALTDVCDGQNSLEEAVEIIDSAEVRQMDAC